MIAVDSIIQRWNSPFALFGCGFHLLAIRPKQAIIEWIFRRGANHTVVIAAFSDLGGVGSRLNSAGTRAEN